MSTIESTLVQESPAEGTPLVVIGGTGAFEPIASWYYEPIGSLAERKQVVCIPNLGLLRLDSTAEQIIERVNEHYEEWGQEPVDLVLHSQGGEHGLIYAIRHPERVRKVVLISTPLHGTQLAPILTPNAAIRFMARGSRHGKSLLKDYRALVGSASSVPQFYSVFTPFDGLVWPFWSSYLKGATNIVIAPRQLHWLLRRTLPEEVILVDGLVNHIDEISSGSMSRLLRGILQGPYDLAA